MSTKLSIQGRWARLYLSRTRILLLSHAIHYLIVCFYALFGSDVFGSGRDSPLRYVIYGCLATQSMVSASMARLVNRLFARWLLGLLLLYLLFLGVLGFSRDNSSSYLAADALIFSLMLCSVVGLDDELVSKVARLYEALLVPGLISAIAILSRLRPATLSARFNSDDHFTDIKLVIQLCAPAAFVYFFSGIRSRRTAVVVLGNLFVLLIYGLFTASRTELMTPFLTMGLGLTFGRGSKKLAIYSLALPAVALLGLAVAPDVAQISESAQATIRRLEFREDMDFSAGREEESEVFLAQTSDLDFLVGRGMGGAYFGSIPCANPYGLNMVHYGHLHLILKGGIFALACFAILALVAIVRGFARRGTVSAAGAAFVALFAIIDIGFTQFSANAIMSLFAISLGAAFRNRPAPPRRLT